MGPPESDLQPLRRDIGNLRVQAHVEGVRRLARPQADGAGDRRLATGRALRSPGHFNPLHVEHAVGRVALVRIYAIHVEGDGGVLVEVDRPVVADTAHVVVTVLVLAGTLAAVAFLETGDEHFQVIGVLHAQSLDDQVIETGHGHGTVQNVGFPPFAGDQDLFDVIAFVISLVGRIGGQPEKGHCHTQRRDRWKRHESLHVFLHFSIYLPSPTQKTTTQDSCRRATGPIPRQR